MAQNSETSAEVRRIIEQSDIVEVAIALGLHVDSRQGASRKAICPFHDDHSPSMSLYKNNGTADNFHCFACGAHGDVVSLIQHKNNIDFWDTIQWLATFSGVKLDESSRRKRKFDKQSGSNFFADKIIEFGNKEALSDFSERRGFPTELLTSVGAGVINLSKLREIASKDRSILEILRNAGIVRTVANDQGGEHSGESVRSFFTGTRVVFPLKNQRGEIEGFAARALHNEKVRYLYSYDFPRRTTLYGADKVAENFRNVRKTGGTLHLYIVEGLFDQLRLQHLKLNAVALLGARASAGQLVVIQSLVKLAEASDSPLTIRIFLDSDTAGRDGTYDLLSSLFRMLDEGHSFAIEVVRPTDQDQKKIDPDETLRNVESEEAEAHIDNFVVPALEFMLGVRTSHDVFPIDISKISALQLSTAAWKIGHSLPNASWKRILAPLETPERLKSFEELIESYGQGTSSSSPNKIELTDPQEDPRAILITALNIGRSSTKRREYPLDEESWERLAIAASPLFHFHQERLNAGDGPMAPFLARHVPKGDGKFRLKSGPVAADALIQQYALIELLRDRPRVPTFSESIPAVRYDRSENGRGIYQTGPFENREALSFAYQVDMAIVNGDAPPAREGIFRPYFDCWRSFIEYLENKIRNYRHEELQILRLDITGFYDHLRKEDVENALQKPLAKALTQFSQADRGPLGFAPLLKPDAGHDDAERANIFTDFLLSHAFYSDRMDPVSGNLTECDGLAQGPDLSAYLANISLFGLDEMMRSEIDLINHNDDQSEFEGQPKRERQGDNAAETYSAAYARYVDDLIIVCPDAEVAARLRRKVESYLHLLGLSLNRKNPTPPAMTRSEALEWLTGNRIGFGFSGPLADLPDTETMDPLADAGEIDRRTALGLLFDPRLDDLRNPDAILQKISRALQASEIRFGDRANAYRRLWLLSVAMFDEGIDKVVHYFSDLVDKIENDSGSIEQRKDIIIAAIEAIERALRSTAPGSLDEAPRELWVERKAQLSRLVLGDIFKPLAHSILKEHAEAFLKRYDTRCQIAIIANLAVKADAPTQSAKTVEPFRKLQKYFSPQSSYLCALPTEIQLSLFRHDEKQEPSTAALAVPSENQARNAFIRLETSLVRLQRYSEGGRMLAQDTKADPSAKDYEKISAKILGIWAPSVKEISGPIEAIEVDAAATLVNIAYMKFAELAVQRPRLIDIISKQSQAVALPSPPGLQATGIMLWCKDHRLLFAALKDSELPIGIDWVEEEPGEIKSLKLWRAKIPEGMEPLFTRKLKWKPDQIASIYETAYPAFLDLLGSDTQLIPVPTAFSFFASTTGKDGDQIDFGTVKLICWAAPRETVDSHAFVRNGDSLEALSVYTNGADHWRYGWAIRDLCARMDRGAEDLKALELHGDANLEREFHRMDAIVARVLPRLSGADRWGPGPVKEGSEIPSRIWRALRLLRAFGQTDDASKHASFLIAATAEGVFMGERLSGHRDENHSGRPAAIAGRAARKISRALPRAGAFWPSFSSPAHAGRRSASAWLALASRIELQADDGLCEDIAVSLLTLATGTRILGVVSELRALAFELASVLPNGSLKNLQSSEIDISNLSDGLEAEISLVEGESKNQSGDPREQLKLLVRTFAQIIDGRQGSSAYARDSITPLGWLIIVATLLQVTPPATDESNEDRPILRSMDPVRLEQAKESVGSLAEFLGASTSDEAEDADWPWECFEQLRSATPKDLSKTLAQLSIAARLRIETIQSPFNPRSPEKHGNKQLVILDDGQLRPLSAWQIDTAYVAGERQISNECAEDESIKFKFSVTWDGNKLIGLHLVSQKMADIAFAAADFFAAAEDLGDIAVPTDISSKHDTGSTTSTEGRSPHGSEVAEAEILPVTRGTESEESRTATSAAAEGVMPRIRKEQDERWGERASRGSTLQRVAIVQWDVADTYYSPAYRGGLHEGLRTLRGEVPSARQVSIGGNFLSVSESRRRAILNEVLRACDRFDVDGLVLPEYSLRAETVNWLSRQLKIRNLELTVWCGTFRVPDGDTLASSITFGSKPPYFPAIRKGAAGNQDWEPHHALITALKSYKKDGEVLVDAKMRPKRYPSAAAGEMIRPGFSQPWAPLFQKSRDPFDLGTYAIDLICAEMFLHASSANYIGILEENKSLASRYSIPWRQEEVETRLYEDMLEFAKWTSSRGLLEPKKLSRGKNLQRTVIILPAMTSRSADYHIFGQNQYLASGLVTAFCNAVEPTAAVGGSAFIGLDGWKSGPEVATPYGSVAPGIFQLGCKHSGPLGTKEAAMIIADIDPLRTTDQKPRPHYQSRSLQLVAHLPLIFATELDQSTSAAGSRDRVIRRRNIDGTQRDFLNAADLIHSVVSAPDEIWRQERCFEHPDSNKQRDIDIALNKTKAALDILTHFADDKGWLKQRAEIFCEKRWHYVPPKGLPALIDWLYVDDTWIDYAVDLQGEHPLDSDHPVIAVPRSSSTSNFSSQ